MNFWRTTDANLPVGTEVAPPPSTPKDIEQGARSPAPPGTFSGNATSPVKQWNSLQPSTRRLILVVLAAVVIVAIIIGVVTSGGGNGEEESEDEAPVVGNGGGGEVDPDQDEFALFPKEFRRPGDMVSVSFLGSTTPESFQGFKQAAERLSDIIKGSVVEGVYQTFFLREGSQICNSVFAPQDINLTHVRLLVAFSDFNNDGPGELLAQAGPCLTDRGRNGFGTRLPFSGQMTFDIADVDLLARDGRLVSVVVHEAAHVLGVGTQWGNLGIARDLVDDSDEGLDNLVLGNPVPKYTGALALREYEDFTGRSESFIPIEDGFTNGNRNRARRGSVNGHFDQDALGIELMTFIIQRRVPPLSRISVASFQDVGFLADVSAADEFDSNIAFGRGRRKDDMLDPKDWLYMENDFTWEYWVDEDVEWISKESN